MGAAKLNAVPVAVNWRLAPPEMAYILDNAEAKVVLIEGEFLDHLAKMVLPGDPMIIEVNGHGHHTAYVDWIADKSTDDPKTPVDFNDAASQLCTSATTGLPKEAELTNRNFDTMIEPVSEMLAIDADSVMLQVLPMFHAAVVLDNHDSKRSRQPARGHANCDQPDRRPTKRTPALAMHLHNDTPKSAPSR